MTTKTMEQFEVLDTETLASVQGRNFCENGILAMAGIGTAGGPWGVVGGVLVGAAIYCLN